MSGEANSDMLRDKPDQINFGKRARVAESIQQIQLHQATPYNLSAVPALVKWLEDELQTAMMAATGGTGMITPTSGDHPSPAVVDPMQRAYEHSVKIEPREREDERSAFTLNLDDLTVADPPFRSCASSKRVRLPLNHRYHRSVLFYVAL